jgi:hypothetical protein
MPGDDCGLPERRLTLGVAAYILGGCCLWVMRILGWKQSARAVSEPRLGLLLGSLVYCGSESVEHVLPSGDASRR